jgi:hypothetical protein
MLAWFPSNSGDMMRNGINRSLVSPIFNFAKGAYLFSWAFASRDSRRMRVASALLGVATVVPPLLFFGAMSLSVLGR